MRSNNIEYGKKADEKIISYLKSLDGFVSIYEIRDNQQNRNNLQGMDKLENDINMHLGIDFVLVIKDKTYYLDTKGFNYSYRNYGSLRNGIVENMLLQVEKVYGNKEYKGWANNPKHLTTHIVILINGHIYIIDYKKLVKYCDKFTDEVEKCKRKGKGNDIVKIYGEKWKGKGNCEICVKASVKDMIENKVITNISTIE